MLQRYNLVWHTTEENKIIDITYLYANNCPIKKFLSRLSTLARVPFPVQLRPSLWQRRLASKYSVSRMYGRKQCNPYGAYESGQAGTWWRHQMETFSTLLAICAGNSPFPSEFPIQRPVTQSFDVFFILRPNKRLSKQWWGWWFETPSLWRHYNESQMFIENLWQSWIFLVD